MAHDNEGSAGAAEEPAETRELAKVIEPDGRTVVLTEHAWLHIINEHRGMERYRRAIMETITHPDDRQNDVRPGRERYFSKNKVPTRWLRVVVDFNRDPGEVVTAFPQDNEP